MFRVSRSTNKTLVYDLLHLSPFWIENKERENEIGLEDDEHYSVLLIWISSVSRSHVLRKVSLNPIKTSLRPLERMTSKAT